MKSKKSEAEKTTKKDYKSYGKRLKCSLFYYKKLFFVLSPLGRVDFMSKVSKRRERIYFYINSDKFLFLNDLYRLELASLSEPLSPKGKAGKIDIFLSFSENEDYLSLNQKIILFYSLFFY